VADTADALGGSYMVEYLTDELERKIREYMDKIESMGGALKAIESQYQKREIENNAYEFQMAVERKEAVIVGVNKFASEHEHHYDIFKVNPKVREIQTEKLKKLRAERDNEAVRKSLKVIREKALTDDNLLPYLLDGIEKYATIGEICNELRGVWGEYR
jgi:methylmalonyl-CoA mutase N-terminal domain/subunit